MSTERWRRDAGSAPIESLVALTARRRRNVGSATERPRRDAGSAPIESLVALTARRRRNVGSATERPRRDAGSALVESLVALVLIALAGLVVATAATTGLRATRRAATLTRATALAGRELARLASAVTAATADATATSTLAVTGFVDPVQCATDVARDGDLVDLAVTVDAGQPAEHVALATRRLTVEEGAP